MLNVYTVTEKRGALKSETICRPRVDLYLLGR